MLFDQSVVSFSYVLDPTLISNCAVSPILVYTFCFLSSSRQPSRLWYAANAEGSTRVAYLEGGIPAITYQVSENRT